MTSIRTDIDGYLQTLLIMQFQASHQINHSLTKGEVREAYIKKTVLGEYPNITIQSGILCSDNWQSSQGDFLWLNPNARVGHNQVYDLNDCKLFMEIKSCATAAELRDIESTAKTLKELCSPENPIRIGMFCYSTRATENTVLKKIGFSYDREIESYCGYQPDLDNMKHVDFLYSLNITKDSSSTPYFVIRDRFGNCTLEKSHPVIRHFFNLFR